MSPRLASSMERRLQIHRRALVLELATHRGPFWKLVDRIRMREQVVAEPRLPPTLDPESVHLPPQLRSLRESHHLDYERHLHDWMVRLNVLHDEVIPDELRVETQFSFSLQFWMGFLSGCLVYDPPAEDLLGFAEHGVAAYGDFVNPLNPWDDGDQPQMLAAPIRFLPDPDTVIAEQQARFDWILDRMQQELERLGITQRGAVELREMSSHFDFLYESELEGERKKRDELPDIPMQPYITVDEHTTEEDVRGAFRLMASALPRRPRPIRPRRDPLVCLQCAIWYDACGWSYEQIGKRMGWTIQTPAEAKPRCETARQHVTEGRAIRDQGNEAA